MDKTLIHQYCDEVNTLIQQIRDEVDETVVDEVGESTISKDADLQSYLDKGGHYLLEYGGTYQKVGGHSFGVSNTSLRGLGDNKITADRGPAVKFDLNFSGGRLLDVDLSVTNYEVICLLGRNDTAQVTLDVVPYDIHIDGVTSTGHRGKRCFDVNAKGVGIFGCKVFDLYDPERLDSQAVLIVNTPGDIEVVGCHLEAASENLMVGGDTVKIPGCRPTNILIEKCVFTKPLAWKSIGIPVKNLLELKDGHNVTIRDCALSNSWKSAQDGYAFMLTPTRGGSLRNVKIENCKVENVGAIVNITGYDSNWPEEHPRTQVEFIGGEYKTNKVEMGGTGRFALIDRGPEYVKFTNMYIRHEGGAFIECGSKPTDALHVIGCDWNYGTYGIRIGGYNHGDNSQGYVKDLKVEGNTIHGANSIFKGRYPNNTYV